MEKKRWRRTDSVIRSVHLYTGLFLAPWLLVYATSGLFLNHHRWFTARLGVTPPSWEVVREVPFTPTDGFPAAPEQRAQAILRHVGLEGAHRILGKPTAQQMVITRISGGGNYRITWRRPRSLVVVERQQSFSLYRLVHFLHFRHGYGQAYPVHLIWAVLVDAVTVTMWLWVLTGVYIWFRRPRQRLLGSVCVMGGSALFIVLVVLLCM